MRLRESHRDQKSGSVVLLVACAALMLGSCVLRLRHLARQSYWTDELFTVTEASGSRHNFWHMGRTEIHPPLFAALVRGWIRLGGGSTASAWTRLLPALCGVLAVLLVPWLLRRSGLSRGQAFLCGAASACCGMAMVHAQDLRSYSMLFLCATGLTAATLVVAHAGPTDARSGWWTWTLWGALASGTHLFGAILVAWCGAVLLVWRWRKHRGVAAAVLHTLVALVPQACWLAYGSTVKGFAQGTSWIDAPVPQDVWHLLTSTFAWGDLSLTPGGFRFSSPLLVLLGAALLLAAALTRLFLVLRGRRTPDADAHADGPARWQPLSMPCLLLGAVCVPFVVVVFLGSQVVHVWTERNMIVVVPALLWFTTIACVELVGRGIARRLMSLALVCLMAAGLAGSYRAMTRPYKMEFGPAMSLLARQRAADPGHTYVYTNANVSWLHASQDRPITAAHFARLSHPGAWIDPQEWRSGVKHHRPVLPPHGMTTVYVFYVPWTSNSPSYDRSIIGTVEPHGFTCTATPLVRVAYVTCTPHS